MILRVSNLAWTQLGDSSASLAWGHLVATIIWQVDWGGMLLIPCQLVDLRSFRWGGSYAPHALSSSTRLDWDFSHGSLKAATKYQEVSPTVSLLLHSFDQSKS